MLCNSHAPSQLYDRNHDGYISLSELVLLIDRSSQHMHDCLGISTEVIASFDVNGDGVISVLEFKRAILEDVSLRSSLTDAVVVSVRVFASH